MNCLLNAGHGDDGLSERRLLELDAGRVQLPSEELLLQAEELLLEGAGLRVCVRARESGT